MEKAAQKANDDLIVSLLCLIETFLLLIHVRRISRSLIREALGLYTRICIGTCSSLTTCMEQVYNYLFSYLHHQIKVILSRVGRYYALPTGWGGKKVQKCSLAFMFISKSWESSVLRCNETFLCPFFLANFVNISSYINTTALSFPKCSFKQPFMEIRYIRKRQGGRNL